MSKSWIIAIISSTFLFGNDLQDAIEYAKTEFKFASKSKDGSTLKDQLNSVWRQTGKKPKELDNLPELPDIFSEVWYWFLKLNNKRTSNGFGVNPIQYSEIKAYFDLIQYHPQEWEIEMIEKFDSIALKEYELQAEKNKPKSKK